MRGWCLKNFYDLALEFSFQLAGFGELVLVYLLAQSGENFFGSAHTDVRAKQGRFELLQQLRIDGAIAGENFFNLCGELRPRFADGVFEALEKSGFGWSEKRNHLLNGLNY